MLERFQKELWKFNNSYSEKNDSEVNELIQAFIGDYSVEHIKNLSLLEYAGQIDECKSFSYRLEFETRIVGIISGQSGNDKFGIYKEDGKYKHTKRYGNNLKDAFLNVKNEILKVIDASIEGDYDTISQSMIAPLIKYKLAYMYNTTNFLSIFSKKHLQRCAYNIFGILFGDGYSEMDLQRMILEEKNSCYATAEWSNYKFSKCMYDIFSLKDSEFINDWSLDKEIEVNIGFLESFEHQLSRVRSEKKDYLSEYIDKTKIGQYGEQLVLKYEKETLKKLGKKQLSEKVKHVSIEDDSLGYDILSYDEDGNKKLIEVKTTRGRNKYFFISENELRKSEELEGYMVYLLSDVMNKKKIRLDIVPSEELKKNQLTPVLFKGKVK